MLWACYRLCPWNHMEGQIWNKSFKNCRNEIKWRMILAVGNTIYTIVQWLCTGKPKRIQDFNGVWTRDLAILVWSLTNWAMKPLMLGTHKFLKTRFNLILFPLITSTQVMNSQTWKINITTLTNLEPFTVFQFFKESNISFNCNNVKVDLVSCLQVIIVPLADCQKVFVYNHINKKDQWLLKEQS